MLHNVLRSEIHGYESGFDRVTTYQAAVGVDELLERTRTSAINILKSMFGTAETDAERLIIIQAMTAATKIADAGEGSKDLKLLVLRDSLTVVQFYTEIASELSYKLQQDLEHDLLWLYRRSSPPVAGAASDNDLAAAQEELRDAILEYSDRVNSDDSFEIYKVLVGYKSVFAPAWEDPNFEYGGQGDYRKRRVEDLVAEVNPDNAAQWLDMLRRCAAAGFEDLAPSFEQFLGRLGVARPEIVYGYLHQLDERLADFLPAMLVGLDGGQCHDAVQALLRQWLSDGRYVRQISLYLQSDKTLDGALLDQALQVAIGRDDSLAVLNLVGVAASRHDEVAGGLVDRLFLPALAFLAKKNDTHWVKVYGLRLSLNQSSLIKALSAEQAGVVLASLVQHPRIDDYEVEEVLAAIATKWPDKVIDFFGKRMRLAPSDRPDGYADMPIKLHRLSDLLSKNPPELVSTVRGWYGEAEGAFAFSCVWLLKAVFPQFSPEFEQALSALVQTGSATDLQFVVRILSTYRGEAFLHSLCKQVVEAIEPNDQLLSEIESALTSTGIVRGEFGLVEAYEEKKKEMDAWLTDPRQRISDFAKRHIRRLEQRAAAERRRSEESFELRRREFGEDVAGEKDDVD